jgi:hypothetical protein
VRIAGEHQACGLGGPVWVIWWNIILERELCTSGSRLMGEGIDVPVGEVEVLYPTLREARVSGWGGGPLPISIGCIPTVTDIGTRPPLAIILLRSTADVG